MFCLVVKQQQIIVLGVGAKKSCKTIQHTNPAKKNTLKSNNRQSVRKGGLLRGKTNRKVFPLSAFLFSLFCKKGNSYASAM